MRKTTRLKQLLLARQALPVPGVYDCLTARLAEQSGFHALQVSGFALSAALLGRPDVGLLSFGEVLEQTRRIAACVDVPVMADGDTGYGNAINVFRTVQELEAAGCAGVNLEDQVFPKRCGHMEGKEVIALEEMVGKIRAAVAARRDPDFIINARTDAIAVEGLAVAIERANAYAAAGADLIFVEAVPSLEAIERVVREVRAPVSINMLDFGKTPLVPLETLRRLGVARVSFPLTAVLTTARAVQQAFEHLARYGFMEAFHPEMMAFEEFTRRMGLDAIRQLEARFLPEPVLADKYAATPRHEGGEGS